MKDFHYASLHHEVEPLAMAYRPGEANHLLVKAEAGKALEALHVLQEEWEELLPGAVFSYGFLDQKIDQSYRAEQKARTIIMSFAVLALIIACMGLYGLSSFTVRKRTKEIGVRKVLGAGVPDIALMLLREFVRLVLLAFAIASPLALWMMNQWLANFAYHVQISWLLVLAVGLAAVAVAVLTIGWQSVRAALANPVESLKNE